MSSSIPKTAGWTIPRLRFGRGFSASRWLRRADDLQQVTSGGNGQEWILARGLCAYTTLDGSAVPAGKRRNYARMAVARWAPFPDADSLVEWIGDRAMVWAWSRSRVLTVDSTITASVVPRRVLPESLFRGEPRPDGEDLVAMDQGYEGRIWQGGFLAAATWWADRPTPEDWSEFRRGVGLPTATSLPDATEVALADKPWTATSSRGLGLAMGEQRVLLAALATAAALAATLALLTSAAALKFSIWQLDGEIAGRALALDKIIAARDSAVADRAAIDAQLRIRPPAGQTRLLVEVDKLLPRGWQLQEWRMPDPVHLIVVARMNNADARALVSAWEASGRFTDVTAEIGRTPGEVKIEATIVRSGAEGRP